MTPNDLAAYAYQAGFRGQDLITAVAVALAESGGDPGAQGDISLEDAQWGASLGLWQIRSLKDQSGTGGVRDGTKLLDPSYNAHSAYITFAQSGFKPWSTYTSGRYKDFLGEAQQAAAGAANMPISDSGGAPGITNNPDELRSVFSTFIGRDPTPEELSRYVGQSPDAAASAIKGTEESKGFMAANAGNELRSIMQSGGTR